MPVDHDERLKKAKRLEDSLTDQQRRYCEARAADVGKRDSAIMAGYAGVSAHVRAHRLELREDISEYIQLLKQGYVSEEIGQTEIGAKLLANIESRESFTVEMEALARRLVRADMEAAFPDPADYFEIENDEVKLKDFSTLTPEQRSRIIGYKLHNVPSGDGTARTEVILQLMDPAAARVRLYRFLGIESGRGASQKTERDDEPSSNGAVKVEVYTPDNARGPANVG